MKAKLLLCFCLPVTVLTAQPDAWMKNLGTIPVRIDMPFEVNDVAVNGKQILLAGTQAEREASGYGYEYTPWLICLDEQLRYKWTKKGAAPFSNAGTTAIAATTDKRVFVAIKEKYSRSCIQEINEQGDSLRNLYLDNPAYLKTIMMLPAKSKKQEPTIVGEINMQGDTVWYNYNFRYEVPKDKLAFSRGWTTSFKKVSDAVITTLFVCHDGRIIAAGKSKCGFAQCIYPAEKRTSCMHYESTEHDGWSEITGVAETENGFVLSASIGTRQVNGFFQESCMLVFTDRELRETKRIVLAPGTRSENQCVVSDGKRIISGGSNPDRNRKVSNFIAITDTPGNTACTRTWGKVDAQDDVFAVSILPSGTVAALHQMGNRSAVSLFSQCDSLHTLVFPNKNDIDEKPVAMQLLPDGNMLVVTRGSDYLDEIRGTVKLTWIRKVTPELKIVSTQILLHTSSR